MTILRCLMEFQTGIVGIIGFAGVIFTLLSTARLARAQVEANARLAREQFERSEAARRRAIKSALLAEMRMFKQIIERNSTDESEGEHFDLIVPRMKRKVSPELIKEIGYLEPEIVDNVLDGLEKIDAMDHAIMLHSQAVCDDHFEINRDKREAFFTLMTVNASMLDDAIAALE